MIKNTGKSVGCDFDRYMYALMVSRCKIKRLARIKIQGLPLSQACVSMLRRNRFTEINIMTGLTDLPVEAILNIAKYGSAEDAIQLAGTSKRFRRAILNDPKLWDAYTLRDFKLEIDHPGDAKSARIFYIMQRFKDLSEFLGREYLQFVKQKKGYPVNAVEALKQCCRQSETNTESLPPVSHALKAYRTVIDFLALPSTQDSHQDTFLYLAVVYGYTKIVKDLLNHPQIDVNKGAGFGNTFLGFRVYGETPLFWATRNCCTETIKALLNHPQIDVNKANGHGETPLSCAAFLCREDITALIIAHINSQQEAKKRAKEVSALVLNYFKQKSGDATGIKREQADDVEATGAVKRIKM